MFGRPQIPSISAEELKQKIAAHEDITLMDVRTPREWAQTGVIPGSIMVEMQTIPAQMENGLNAKLKAKEPIIVICRSGNRSAQVTNFLRQRYNIEAINLSGGVISWHRIGESFEQV